MCGVHSVNALLQGPIFDEIKMSQIGLALDKEEQELLGGGSAGAQARFDMDKQNLREGMTSSNVANDGNFSIQVIQRALEQFGKIKCIPILQEDVAKTIKDYCDEEAYICNSKDHWLTIRKIHGVWYNLNSTNWMPPGGSGPQIIGNFYLGAFLDSI